MKRITGIFVLAALAVFTAGCSRNADVEPSVAPEDAWVHDITLPVPIEFAPMGETTKGIVNGNEDLTTSSVFGMFAVAEGAEDLSADDGLNMRNKLCTYNPSTQRLQFGYAAEDRLVYYPANGNSFTFYAYHEKMSDDNVVFLTGDSEPLQTVSESTSSSRQIIVAMTLARPHDVLYAKAEAPYFEQDGVEIPGFSSEYIRKSGNIPDFNFVHPAAAVRLRVVLDPESTKTITRWDHLKLMHVTMTGHDTRNIATKANLCMVDLDNRANEGVFMDAVTKASYKNWMTSNNSTGNLNFDVLADADGDGAMDVCLEEPAMLTSEHFIMPMSEPLEITVTMRRQRIDAKGNINGNWLLAEETFVLDPSAFDPSLNGFEAGKMYNYKIIVKYTNAYPSDGTYHEDSVELQVVEDV